MVGRREHSRRLTSSAVPALLIVVALALAACDGADVAARIGDEAANATSAANAARAALESSNLSSAKSYAATADTKSEQALSDAASQTVGEQTKQTVAEARSEALGVQTEVTARTVAVSDNSYEQSVRTTVEQTMCTVVNNALEGQQQPNAQQWTQQIDSDVQNNLQNLAGGQVPQAVIDEAIAAVHQYIDPWIQKYNDLVQFDPENLGSYLQTYKDYMGC